VLVQLSGVATVLGWVADRWTPAELWHRWLHSPAVRAFETGRCDADSFAADLVSELDLGVAPALFLESFAAWPTGLYPGTRELIARIPGHITRALLSNSNALHCPASRTSSASARCSSTASSRI
jgi:putative hydrolase of the HAD superfamily